MEFYNIKQCAADLAQADYIEELSKPAIKHFRIFDKRDSVIIYALNVRGAMQALADRLRVRGDDRCAPNSVDLRMYSDGYHSKTAHYTDADELTAEELTDVETDELNAALDWVETFSREMSKEFWYMVEWGNGYDERTAAVYNLLSYIQHENKTPDGMPEGVKNWIFTVFPHTAKVVATDIEREQSRRAQLKAFYAAYDTIFESCLRFNIDMGFYNEKPGGLAEQAALDFVSTIKYNGFSVREFEAIVNYLNAHFWAYYRPGNPNNYQKNYTLFFGRESSVVLYIEAKFENDVEIKKTIADLKRIVRPDEIGIESEMPTWDGKRRARLRLWWD